MPESFVRQIQDNSALLAAAQITELILERSPSKNWSISTERRRFFQSLMITTVSIVALAWALPVTLISELSASSAGGSGSLSDEEVKTIVAWALILGCLSLISFLYFSLGGYLCATVTRIVVGGIAANQSRVVVTLLLFGNLLSCLLITGSIWTLILTYDVALPFFSMGTVLFHPFHASEITYFGAPQWAMIWPVTLILISYLGVLFRRLEVRLLENFFTRKPHGHDLRP